MGGVALAFDNQVTAVTEAASLAAGTTFEVLHFLKLLAIPAAVLVGWGWRTGRLRVQPADLGFAILGSILFQVAFSGFKSMIPFAVPFYADPWLADLDRFLHGGTDPWRLAHEWAGWLDADRLSIAYHSVWAIPAVLFPAILSVVDQDHARRTRFVMLYVAAWLVVGFVLALPGSSVGPVFYDRYYGGTRFADLTAMLAANPVLTGSVGVFQDYLWNSLGTSHYAFGSGIAAFPSVHVSVAVVFALYLAERWAPLAAAGAVSIVLVIFLSVYTGYHYAIDGYVSVAVMVALWVNLRRRDAAIRPGAADLAVDPIASPGRVS